MLTEQERPTEAERRWLDEEQPSFQFHLLKQNAASDSLFYSTLAHTDKKKKSETAIRQHGELIRLSFSPLTCVRSPAASSLVKQLPLTLAVLAASRFWIMGSELVY